MNASRSIRFGVILIALLFLLHSSAVACQETCVEIVTSSKRAVLLDFDGNPVGKASVVIRDALKGAHGRCGNFGEVAKTTSTDSKGRFDLSSLRPGSYWITYMDEKNGESFFVTIDPKVGSKHALDLSLDHLSGLCYLVDVERNRAKTKDGLPKPIDRD